MKRLFAFVAAFALACGLLASRTSVRAESAGDAGVYPQIESYLDRAVKNAHIPAASVIIVDKESTLFCRQYGGADADTPFLLGSVSKSFTAACVMQLVERGRVKLDSPVSEYLPDARYGGRITVRELLTHTGGLGEHQTLKNYTVGEKGKHVYANVNYTLLGKIVEAVGGKAYESYVKENIFQPLDMARSAATREESQANGLVQGYRNYFGISVKSAPRYPKDENAWISAPAGYLSASAADLGKYLQAYLNGGRGILSAESVNAMFYGGVRVEASVPYSYGFGWTLIQPEDSALSEPVLRHSGLVETGMSCIYLLPERGLGAAVLVNTNDYFVTKDMMDRLDWSIPLLLLGEGANEIGESEYALRHLGYDAAYFAVFALSLLPFFFMRRYFRRVTGKKLAARIVLLVLVHALCPAFLLLLPRLCFATPLWVVYAFVPDFFLAETLSAVLLFFGGVYKTAFMLYSGKSSRR